MKLIDSNKQLLDTMQLLHQYYENSKQTGKLNTFNTWVVAMTSFLSDPKVEFRKFGNSLMVVRRNTPADKAALMWMLNVDTLDNAPINLAGALVYFKSKGITDFVGIYSEKIVTRILRKAFSEIKGASDTLDVSTSRTGKIVARAHFDSELTNV